MLQCTYSSVFLVYAWNEEKQKQLTHKQKRMKTFPFFFYLFAYVVRINQSFRVETISH